MKLNDKVRFLNEKLKGTITRIIDDKTVAVEVEDGFEIPVLKSEIVLETTNEPVNVKIVTAAPPNNKPEGIYIVLEQRFNTYYYQKIYNYNSCDISFICYQKNNQDWIYKSHAVLKPNTGLLLDNVDFTETDKWPEFFITVSLHKNITDQIPEPQLFQFRYKSKDYIHAEVNNEAKKVFFVKQESYKAKIKVEVERSITPQIQVQQTQDKHIFERPETVVDLHIEKLHTHSHLLSAEEALQLQVNTFNNNFEKALSLNYSKIIFIHGVGSGLLKNHIWNILSKSKEIRNYKEAMKEKFGYGATEIVFK